MSLNFINSDLIDTGRLKGSIDYSTTSRAGPEDAIGISLDDACLRLRQHLEISNALYTEIVGDFFSIGNLSTDFEIDDPTGFYSYYYVEGWDFGKICLILEEETVNNIISSVQSILSSQNSNALTLIDGDGLPVTIKLNDEGILLESVYIEGVGVVDLYGVLYHREIDASEYHAYKACDAIICYYLDENDDKQYLLNTKILCDNDLGRGEVILSNLIQSMAQSLAMNEVLYTATEQALNNTFNASAVETIIKGSYSSLCSSAKQVLAILTTAYNNSGLINLKSAICAISRVNTTVISSGTGLQFTNNDVLLPQEYIAGMVLHVIGAVTTVVGLIVSIYTRVIGPIISGLGMLIYKLGTQASYDYKVNTTAAIANEEDVNSATFPHGFLQVEYNVQNGSYVGTIVNDIMTTGKVYKIGVPGGILLLSMYNKDSSWTYFRAEFHPELACARWGNISTWGPARFFKAAVQNTGVLPFSPATAYFELPVGYISVDYILSAWANRQPYNVSNNSDGVLDINDDAKIRAIMMSNIALFLLFINCNLSTSQEMIFNNRGVTYFPFGTLRNDLDFNDYSDTAVADPIGEPSYQSTADTDNALFNGDATNLVAAFKHTLAWAFVSHQFASDEQHAKYFVRCITEGATVVPSWTELYNVCKVYNDPTSKVGKTMWFSNSVPTTYQAWTLLTLSNGYNSRTGGIEYISEHNLFIGEAIYVPSDIKHCIKTPKYNRSTFILWVLVAILTTTAVIAATVAVTLVGKNLVRRARAKRARNVETSWNDFIDDPSNENYKAYRKAVSKNNRFSAIFGGTKFSKDGMWADVSDGSGLFTNLQALDQYTYQENNNDLIVKLIKG